MIDISLNVCQTSDMIETNTRDFTRRFSDFRAKAAQGESIRISSPDGVFLFAKEPRGLRAGDLLARLESGGFLAEDGPERIEDARTHAEPAKSPWD